MVGLILVSYLQKQYIVSNGGLSDRFYVEDLFGVVLALQIFDVALQVGLGVGVAVGEQGRVILIFERLAK